jgi:DNA-binding NarL/FixJ family response regulator
MPSRLLLVDDSAVVRRSLRTYIEAQTDWEICGEAENGKRAVEMAQTLSPDVIVLDLTMPVMNGLDAARQIRKHSRSVYIVLFTMHASAQLAAEAQKVGVNEVLSKSAGASRLVSAVRSSLDA